MRRELGRGTGRRAARARARVDMMLDRALPCGVRDFMHGCESPRTQEIAHCRRAVLCFSAPQLSPQHQQSPRLTPVPMPVRHSRQFRLNTSSRPSSAHPNTAAISCPYYQCTCMSIQSRAACTRPQRSVPRSSPTLVRRLCAGSPCRCPAGSSSFHMHSPARPPLRRRAPLLAWIVRFAPPQIPTASTLAGGLGSSSTASTASPHPCGLSLVRHHPHPSGLGSTAPRPAGSAHSVRL